ncbi:MAG: RcnB family protein [Comamonas sp.]|nr:RcnB family protein [Candidatus Comamonas equi]
MQLQRFASSFALTAVLALTASAAAYAQPHGGHGGPRHGGPPPHAHGPSHGHGPHPGWHGGPHGPRPGYHRPPPPPPAHYYHRGAGPQHNWVMGSRIPPQYRGPRYVVSDWRGHRLHQPPRGYHWVRHGGDYMLVAIASGVITQLIINGIR